MITGSIGEQEIDSTRRAATCGKLERTQLEVQQRSCSKKVCIIYFYPLINKSNKVEVMLIRFSVFEEETNHGHYYYLTFLFTGEMIKLFSILVCYVISTLR